MGPTTSQYHFTVTTRTGPQIDLDQSIPNFAISRVPRPACTTSNSPTPFVADFCRRGIAQQRRACCLSASPTNATRRLASMTPGAPVRRDDYFFFAAAFRFVVFFAVVFFAADLVFALAFFAILPS
jgi:hypothetical protein